MNDAHGSSPLGRITPFQAEVVQAFFTLDESEGFFIAGGMAMIANGIVDRDTEDLDAFTSRADVLAAGNALEDLASRRGWDVRKTILGDSFVRLRITHGNEEMKVELARDSAPLHAVHATFLGPTLVDEDAVGNKMLALFGRAEPRDFTDVFDAAARFTPERMVALATERDAGFDTSVFAQMIASLDRAEDGELPCPPERVPALRTFFSQWRAVLTGSATRMPQVGADLRLGQVTMIGADEHGDPKLGDLLAFPGGSGQVFVQVLVDVTDQLGLTVELGDAAVAAASEVFAESFGGVLLTDDDRVWAQFTVSVDPGLPMTHLPARVRDDPHWAMTVSTPAGHPAWERVADAVRNTDHNYGTDEGAPGCPATPAVREEGLEL